MQRGYELTIGAVAERTGCSVPTIRYYEEIGLLPKAARTPAGRRTYGEPDLSRLLFIRRCRDFGFPIEQIRALGALFVAGDRDCTGARDLAHTQLGLLRRKMQELRELESSLAALVVIVAPSAPEVLPQAVSSSRIWTLAASQKSAAEFSHCLLNAPSP